MKFQNYTSLQHLVNSKSFNLACYEVNNTIL